MEYFCTQDDICKVMIKENEQEYKVTIEFTDNVACKYPDTKFYIEENLKERT